MNQALEQILENTFKPNTAQNRIYKTIDLYSKGTIALYTPPIKPPEIKPIIKENKQNNNIFKPILPNPFSENYQKEKTQGFGKDFGLRTGFVYNKLTIDGNDLYFRIRADNPHKGMNNKHLNIETIYYGKKKKPIIDNIHEPFDWKK